MNIKSHPNFHSSLPYISVTARQTDSFFNKWIRFNILLDKK